ncbi:BSD domain protein [Teladorsagia circumcincta]|uniref:BSD domain protein n=1 Tax=Teladorsagia circumcincta TaxID=45464 RepID=A0A2G9TZA6_TELCI|nr:BSD domain protein [Teladorsagia circumcincta]
MSEEKPSTPLVTEEPGKDESKPAQLPEGGAAEEELPSLNPLPAAWISAVIGISSFDRQKSRDPFAGTVASAALKRTKNTFDLMKKDLAEFGDAMSQEVADLTTAAKGGIDTATTVIKEQAQYLEKLVTPDEEEKPMVVDQGGKSETEVEAQTDLPKSQSYESTLAAKVEKGAALGLGWVKTVVDTVTDTVKSLAVEETTEGEGDITEVIRPRIFRKTILPPEKLLEIQSSEDTYRKEPENSEGYSKWVARFNIEEYDAEINLLIANNPTQREIYSKMVPSEMDSKMFWSRYFFAVQIAEMDEELRHAFSLKELTVKTGADGKKQRKGAKEGGDSPESDGSIAVVDQQPTSPAPSADDWSVCSEKNYVEEISSTNGEDEQSGPLTPRAKDEDEAKGSKKKDDNWVDWEE